MALSTTSAKSPPFQGGKLGAAPSRVTILKIVDLKRRWKSTSLKVQHLRLELELRDEELRKLEQQFSQELLTIEIEDLDVENKQDLFMPLENPSQCKELSPQSAIPSDGAEDVKKLWRSIAIVAHPDKTGNDPYKTELYKKAAVAWANNSYGELYNIAIDLNIEPPDLSESSLRFLIESIQKLEQEINNKQNSLLWLWGSSPREKKDAIIDIYLKSRGKRRK